MKAKNDDEQKKDVMGITGTFETARGKLKYYNLKKLEEKNGKVRVLPFSVRILLENAVRNFDGFAVREKDINAILNWKSEAGKKDIPYMPARVLMQDFTGVPSVVDIASVRSEAARHGMDPSEINPRIPVDLIIDHSVQVDYFGTRYAYGKNVETEYERNKERYSLLKWAKSSYGNFNVLPPGMGICHQVNLEYLAQVITVRDGYAFPDTLVGTDSHTPMVNGIGVAGWGVGGIEAEAAILGQPVNIVLPRVVGLKLTGKLQEGTTSTDMVLTIAELLRKHGVVGKFVEVFGEGLDNLTVPDRATISNMSPEFGCTMTYFPVDNKTLEYLKITGRDKDHIEIVEQYAKTNLMWRENESMIEYSEVAELDLSKIDPAVAGPKRPQDKITLRNLKVNFKELLKTGFKRDYVPLDERASNKWFSEGGHFEEFAAGKKQSSAAEVEISEGKILENGLKSVDIKVDNSKFLLSDGAAVIAAITSCTNTSNPSVMIGAGLVAKKAVETGLKVKPWVKTSLAPGSKVVTAYLEKAELLPYLEALGFHVVGYGCTTCIGNSGQLPAHIAEAVVKNDLVVASVLSGNRNFEARIHPLVKMNFLASPMLVVAFAIAGRIDINLLEEPLGFDPNFKPVYLKDIWPAQSEIQDAMLNVLDSKDYKANYENIFEGDANWRTLGAPEGPLFGWEAKSTYIKEAPFFKNLPKDPPGIKNISSARVLLMLGDSITTDHISPAGAIDENSPAGKYLTGHGVEKKYFNSYGSRRGNHEVMVRGTFANVRLKNKMVDKEGGWTIYHPSGEIMTVFDAAMRYIKDRTPLIVLAGKEYGSGSSRDWAAKGVSLLGVKAVIAESYERIHRSNLVGMGVLPLQFNEGENASELGLKGDEKFHISDLESPLSPGKELKVRADRTSGSNIEFKVILRLDSEVEITYFNHGGILQYVLRKFLKH